MAQSWNLWISNKCDHEKKKVLIYNPKKEEKNNKQLKDLKNTKYATKSYALKIDLGEMAF